MAMKKHFSIGINTTMFHFVFLCIYLILAGEQYAAGSPVPEYEFKQETGAWLRLHVVPATWQSASLRCDLDGGILASPTSPAMTAAMTAMMAAHKLPTRIVFTGIHALNAKGEFVSLEGVPLANMSLSWAEGQPDNADNAEDCLALTGAGALADVRCGSVLPYFCRMENKCATLGKGYEWEPSTGSCYKFHHEARTWYRALKACHSEGGHLAIINSETESHVLKKIFEKHRNDTTESTDSDYAHVGFFKTYGSQNNWLTIHGETLQEAGFDKWDEGEPSNGDGEEHCGSIFENGLLNDLPCDKTDTVQQFSFICEFTP